MNDLQKFTDFGLTDFVWNDEFRRWILTPDADSDFFWNNWLTDNPGKKPLAEAARKVICSLKVKEQELPEEVINAGIYAVLDAIDKNETGVYKENRIARVLRNRYWQAGLAASLVIMVAIGFVIWYSKEPVKATITYKELVKTADEKLIEKTNLSDEPLVVLLQDGSKVSLEKKAKISYSSSFNTLSRRKVYLSGSALFEVARNDLKPFLLYTNGLIAKVLGTTFMIHTTDADKKVSVEVISGIVSVYSYIDKRSNEEGASKKINSLILTANQKANYSAEDKTLTATLVTNPAILSTKEINFTYDATSIDSVFRSIENAYGIDIIYDEKSIGRRTFTATLTTESMYEKMDIICKTIGARYEIIDGKIVVYSNVSNP